MLKIPKFIVYFMTESQRLLGAKLYISVCGRSREFEDIHETPSVLKLGEVGFCDFDRIEIL